MGQREPFDLGLANELYTTLIGPVETPVKDKRHLLGAPLGPLPAVPFHPLVTERPLAAASPVQDAITVENMAPYRDAAWQTKQRAVSVMPSSRPRCPPHPRPTRLTTG